MPLPLHIVDAFTNKPFTGNPAAVCILDRPRDDSWMQSIAAEMNLSETAFLLKDSPTSWNLRWFTPKIEVDLCGHATLAAAHILWQTAAIAPTQPAIFQTRSGQLTCTKQDDWIEMDFPAEPPIPADDTPADLLTALNIPGQIPHENIAKKRNRMDFLVEVPDEKTVRTLNPDFRALAKIPVRGIIVTARSQNPQYDFVSRFFAPAAGVDEDPVTGSAHCCLAPYWSAKLGKTQMVAHQASPRGGTIRLTTKGPRVLLAGQAITILKAELLV